MLNFFCIFLLSKSIFKYFKSFFKVLFNFMCKQNLKYLWDINFIRIKTINKKIMWCVIVETKMQIKIWNFKFKILSSETFLESKKLIWSRHSIAVTTQESLSYNTLNRRDGTKKQINERIKSILRELFPEINITFYLRKNQKNMMWNTIKRPCYNKEFK